ncbi:MAG: 4Fe-4S binding protein [Candidatus Heimdallarchaeota archaeon]
MPGIKITVSEKCIGCGDCQQDICFINAISMKNGKAVINETICRGCGRCINVCKQKAIELTIFDPEFLNESLRRISSAVEVD